MKLLLHRAAYLTEAIKEPSLLPGMDISLAKTCQIDRREATYVDYSALLSSLNEL